MPGVLAAAAFLLGGFAAAPGAVEGGEMDFKVAPGPTTMSEEEKAIAPDPAVGSQHAVILLEETLRDDSDISYPKMAYHLRAKILSNEARDLANVTIPFNSKTGYLNQWWGRVILPDGTVQDSPREDLKEQKVIKGWGLELRVLRAVLRGAVPGCVIDYGWAFRGDRVDFVDRVPLQRSWPIQDLRYRWLPSAYFGSSYRILRAEGLSVKVALERGSLTIRATDLPPVPDEPMMPPDDMVRSGVILYYRSGNAADADFWDQLAKDVEKGAREAVERRKGMEAFHEKIASLDLPAEAGLHAKLAAVYDWLGASVKTEFLRTAEEREAEAEVEARKEKESRGERKWFEPLLTWTLREGTASTTALARLFLGFARALGAEANLVLAADRTDHFWDPGLFTDEQFDETIVAVRAPGEPDSSAVFVAAGSGLPYGDIPWWITPAKGLLATASGAREITLPPSAAERNRSQTRATISFGDGTAPAEVLWTHSASGQHGLLEMRTLRRLGPDERSERIEEWCGAGQEFEVTRVEGPKLEEPVPKFEFACEGHMTGAHFDPSQDQVAVHFDGAWIEKVPELPRGPRVHPVILRYPRVDIASVELVAPGGFDPGQAPAPVRVETRYGRYILLVTKSPIGYSVRRDLALRAVHVRPEAYDELRQFLEQVRRADHTPLEFVRATASPPPP